MRNDEKRITDTGKAMTSSSGETRISDKRLQELIEHWSPYISGAGKDSCDALRELAETRRGDWVMVPQSTVNYLLSVKPEKCPAKVREALYELASLAAAPKEGT